MALWQRQGSAYVLVAQNDDADVLAAGQGFFDAGLQLSSPAAGHYLVTVGASPNVPLGTLLSQGFGFDPSYGPIAVQPIAQWNQPSYDVNANDQKGSFWRINLSGVENAVALPAVPEPASWMLAIAGLGVIGWVGRRRR
jgi:hypothetical protein